MKQCVFLKHSVTEYNFSIGQIIAALIVLKMKFKTQQIKLIAFLKRHALIFNNLILY